MIGAVSDVEGVGLSMLRGWNYLGQEQCLEMIIYLL